jgi:formylglycine-generating enzyme required for sulfatase activity
MKKSLLLLKAFVSMFTVYARSATAEQAGHTLKPSASFHDCRRGCPEMIALPPGSFLMGASPTDEHQGADGVEQPQHRVNIGYGFAVGKFEIMKAEYVEFARATNLKDPDGCNVHEPPHWPKIMGLSWRNTPFPQTERDPVVCVSWQEAQAYTQWLSKKTGYKYRLLSEAEWEYADRAGTTTQAFWGDNQEEACSYANGVDLTLVDRFPNAKWENIAPCHDGHIFTAALGSYKPNAFGLHDMEGNVFEWVMDCWIKNYGGAPSDGSPRLDGECDKRVNRGGSWTSAPTGLRSTHRDEDSVDHTRVVDLGFRVARDL